MKIKKEINVNDRGFKTEKDVLSFIESDSFKGRSEASRREFLDWCVDNKTTEEKTKKVTKETKKTDDEVEVDTKKGDTEIKTDESVENK